MVVKTIEELKKQVWENTLHTCEYVSGEPKLGTKIRVRCVIHNEEFEVSYDIIRRDDRKHHVCPKCKLLDKHKESIELICDYCGKKYFSAKSKANRNRHSYHFCCRKCKDLAQRLGSGEKFSDLHPDPGQYSRYRQSMFKSFPHKCAVCGWDDDEDCLEVHHIDENRSNNAITNLIILCPNCHKKLSVGTYELIGNTIVKKELHQ